MGPTLYRTITSASLLWMSHPIQPHRHIHIHTYTYTHVYTHTQTSERAREKERIFLKKKKSALKTRQVLHYRQTEACQDLNYFTESIEIQDSVMVPWMDVDIMSATT